MHFVLMHLMFHSGYRAAGIPTQFAHCLYDCCQHQGGEGCGRQMLVASASPHSWNYSPDHHKWNQNRSPYIDQTARQDQRWRRSEATTQPAANRAPIQCPRRSTLA